MLVAASMQGQQFAEASLLLGTSLIGQAASNKIDGKWCFEKTQAVLHVKSRMSLVSNSRTTQGEQADTYMTSLAYLISCSSAATKELQRASISAPALVATAISSAKSHLRDSSCSAPIKSGV